MDGLAPYIKHQDDNAKRITESEGKTMFDTLTRTLPVRRPVGLSLFARLRAARALSRSRHALAHLDATRLSDIGITAAQAREEARRKPWDAPANWTK
jgi:uncharacterized protein YjiS (DUF1127 family)